MKNIRLMFAVKFFFWMHFFSAVIIPFFTDWGGLKFSSILYLNAWFMLWIFLLEIPTGTVADLISRRTSLILASVTGLAAVLIYTSTPHIAVFMTGEVFFAVSFTLMSGADEAMIYDSLVQEGKSGISKKIFSLLESFKLAGIVVGALIGGVLAKFLGLRATVMLMIVPIAVSLVISLFLTEPSLSEIREKRPYLVILKKGVGYFFGNRVLKVLAADLIIVSGIAWLIIWFYQPFLIRAGVSIVYFGVVHSLMSVSQIIVISSFSGLEKILGKKKKLLFLTTFITGISFITLALAPSPVVAIAAIITGSAFGLSRSPLFSSYLNKFIPSGERATVLSTVSMLRTVAIVVMNPVAGLLGDWSISGTMLILGSALILFAFISPVKEHHLQD